MNRFQEDWWHQAKSDHEAFLLIRRQGCPQCHSLHYLQMVTEKIAKAYFWRSGSPPPQRHSGFPAFLRFSGQIRASDRDRIADLFTFKRYSDFQSWIRTVIPIAHQIEHLAPSLSGDGPNPEYPWPHTSPEFTPANHNFAIWPTLTSGRGRDLMRVIHIAVDRFPDYADT